MRIAHISDLHVHAMDGIPWTQFINKRLTGYLNLRYRRHAIHREETLRAVLRGITAEQPDHVVITGDITNLAFASEFERARRILREELRMESAQISMVPGNHDTYTAGAQRTHRFRSYFQEFTTSDVDHPAVDVGPGHFPFVRIRGPVAIVGISTAIARPPMVAAGKIGRDQLDAIRTTLDTPEVRTRTPILMLHHPPRNPPSKLKTLLEGLRDADQLLAIAARHPRGVLLHGHLHRRIEMAVNASGWQSFGTTSASLQHDNLDRMAGFNVYTFGADGTLRETEAHVLAADGTTFTRRSIPKLPE